MPAFIAAVAARECGEVAADMREADGEWLREVPSEGEVLRELRSGAIAGSAIMY
jgi:hypothetical protein